MKVRDLIKQLKDADPELTMVIKVWKDMITGEIRPELSVTSVEEESE